MSNSPKTPLITPNVRISVPGWRSPESQEQPPGRMPKASRSGTYLSMDSIWLGRTSIENLFQSARSLVHRSVDTGFDSGISPYFVSAQPLFVKAQNGLFWSSASGHQSSSRIFDPVRHTHSDWCWPLRRPGYHPSLPLSPRVPGRLYDNNCNGISPLKFLKNCFRSIRTNARADILRLWIHYFVYRCSTRMGSPLTLCFSNKSNNSFQILIRRTGALDICNSPGQNICGVLSASIRQVYWRC